MLKAIIFEISGLIYFLEDNIFENKIMLVIVLVAFGFIVVNYGFRMVEMLYVIRKGKPLFVHKYLFLRKLTPNQKSILRSHFHFYNKLTKKQQGYFEHRLALFIKDKDFIGREGLIITNEKKVLISATAIMLTFGFRDFYIGLLVKIVVYPDAFYSNINKQYHKGEFNPKLRTIVLSWQDFKEGYDVANDNLNLGIHEFTHAIHLNGMKERDVSSNIFQDSFKELTVLLSNNEKMKKKLIDSKYFREYAYTNQFEFLAVIIETFIESPLEFRSQFPQVYNKVKQMLNFDFAGY